MLAEARRRVNGRVELVEASAEALPFADGEFDALTFTYLLRYVDDPAATLRELARVVRPGGTIAGLEFGVPHGLGGRSGSSTSAPACRPRARVIGARLARGRLVPRPVDPRLLRAAGRSRGCSSAWRAAGIDDVARAPPLARRRGRDVGTEGLASQRPARVLRAPPGRLARLRHAAPPAVHAWHLSYVALGAALAPHFHLDRMLWTLAAFALALGVAAHALDELNGRPLRTRIPAAGRSSRSPSPRSRGALRDRRLGGVRVGLRPARVRRGRRVPRARPTTSSGSAAGSTPTGGSRSPGAPSRS